MKKRICRADLHVHSMYSEKPSEWILKTIGASESYTSPEAIYAQAKKNGMDFVTITDHNRIDGALLLHKIHPTDTFLGVELTTRFPEDNCKVHVLVYGFTEEQFPELLVSAKDIYLLRTYIKKNELPYSVAHATYAVNGNLTIDALEKLILLFDRFEGINGGRNALHNETWVDALRALDKDRFKSLRNTYGIQPFSHTGWMKSFTGGSDDHAGLFSGMTYTSVDAHDVKTFLRGLRDGECVAGGRHNDFHMLAFTLYKIGYDMYKSKNNKLANSFFTAANDTLFENKPFSFVDKLTLTTLKIDGKARNDKIKSLFIDLIENAVNNSSKHIDEKLSAMYDDIAAISDEYFADCLHSFSDNLSKGDLLSMVQKISASLFGIGMAAPFMTTLNHLFHDRKILKKLEKSYVPEEKHREKSILWFSDTTNDLNGVSVTLKKIGWLSFRKNKQLNLVGSLAQEELSDELPPNFINLPIIYQFNPPMYTSYTLKIPSLLRSLKLIYDKNPSEIIISTPGAVGLLGLLAAKLMHVKCKIIFHTDFTAELREIMGSDSILALGESYLRWFYSQGDEILVPTCEYGEILEERGYPSDKIEMFKRGIDRTQYYYRETGKIFVQSQFGIDASSPILLYTGRISKDKNLDFLMEVFTMVKTSHPDAQLVLAGKGPYLSDLRHDFRDVQSIHFVGKVTQDTLPYLYSAADVFLFPSVTDTFGMSVLEAQACGCPALVTNVGGPKEIVSDSRTGFVLDSTSVTKWHAAIEKILSWKATENPMHEKMRNNAQRMVAERFDWENILQTLFDDTHSEKVSLYAK